MARILIVDDYQEICDLYADILTKSGHEVSSVEKAEDAVGKILEGGFDLILLDLLMPEKDGLWVLDQIQGKTPKKPNGKIVVMGFDGNNKNGKNMIQAAISKGAAEFMDKRLTLEEKLISKIEDLLKNK
jgi:two-component system, NtrC family, response regulator HydG